MVKKLFLSGRSFVLMVLIICIVCTTSCSAEKKPDLSEVETFSQQFYAIEESLDIAATALLKEPLHEDERFYSTDAEGNWFYSASEQYETVLITNPALKNALLSISKATPSVQQILVRQTSIGLPWISFFSDRMTVNDDVIVDTFFQYCEGDDPEEVAGDEKLTENWYYGYFVLSGI